MSYSCWYLLLLLYCAMFVVVLRHVSVEQNNYLLTYLLTYNNGIIAQLSKCSSFLFHLSVQTSHPT